MRKKFTAYLLLFTFLFTSVIGSNFSVFAEDNIEEPIFYCDKEEHTHIDTCYSIYNVLDCEESHIHEGPCFSEYKFLDCTEEEHTHDKNCEDKNYKESEPEVVEPTEEEKKIEKALKEEDNLYISCEDEEHTHVKECFKEYDLLNCKEEHEHTEECSIKAFEIICEKEEHSHNIDCVSEKEVEETEETDDEAEEKIVDEIKKEDNIEENNIEETKTEEVIVEENVIEEPTEEIVEELLTEPAISYVENDEVSALIAENIGTEKELIEELVEENFEKSVAKTLSRNLMSAPHMKSGLAPEGVERQGDGSNIENISAVWVTPDTIDNDNPNLLYVKPPNYSDSEQKLVLQINYALSGEHDYEPGDVTITMPAHIFKNRDGNDYGGFVIPYAEEPSTKNDFNWKRIGDNYILTNTRKMSAATKGYIQFMIDGLIPHEIVDMEETAPYSAYIEVVTHKGNIIGLESNDLTAQIDTEARVTSATKRAQGKPTRVKASEIPESMRVDGEEEYIIVNWSLWGRIVSNTMYDLNMDDVVFDDYDGFVVSVSSNTGTINDRNIVDNVYDAYRGGDTRTWTIKTAYPASQFEPDVEYTFNNKVTLTLTEEDPERGDDPQLVTTADAQAKTVFIWHLPQWIDPTGHFMIWKNGNDDNVGKSTYDTHKYYDYLTYSDRNLRDNGYWGIYNKALNVLRDGAETYEIGYTVNTLGYTMPWTYEPDGTPEGARKLSNYGQHDVTMVSEEMGLRIDRVGNLTVHEDYEFKAIEFPYVPIIYSAVPHNINPDGSWAALTAGDGTFLYREDRDNTHIPEVILEIYKNGEWTDYAKANYTTGTPVVSLMDGTPIEGIRVNLPEGTDNFRTRVRTNLAGMSYDMRPIIELKNTDRIKNNLERWFETSSVPTINVWNKVNMKVYVDDSTESILYLEKDGFDKLRGYKTDTKIVPHKSSKQLNVDYEKRQVTLRYNANVEQRSYINDKFTYEEAIADGTLSSETSGIWRDLLPKGVTPLMNTIKLREDDKIINSYTIENYKNSGRTLLVVEAELTPVTSSFTENGERWFEDVITIQFDAIYGFDEILDYGDNIHNVISYESGRESFGSINNYKAEPDDPSVNNNTTTSEAFADDVEKGYMTNLNEEHDHASFVYAGTWTNLSLLSAARTSLSKDIQANFDGWWSDGLYYDDEENNKRTVYTDGYYQYRLRMMSDTDTISKDLIILDSLENFYAGDGNDVIDIDAPRWQGELYSIDVSQLEHVGCAPVIYYSLVENLILSDETNPKMANTVNTDLTNGDVWIRADEYQGNIADVKAIAIDASKNQEGEDFVLQPLESAVVIVTMHAPGAEEAADYIAQDAHAYNNAYLLCTSIDASTGESDSDNFVRKDYTKIGLEEYKLTVKKIWNDDNNRDGIRPEEITIRLFADGVDTGRTLTISDNEEHEFTNLPYTTPTGKKIIYSIKEDTVTGYTPSISKNGMDYTVTNKHNPEKISISGVKTWVGDEKENRPEYITLHLLANGAKVNQVTVRPNFNGEWKYTFDNIFKYENGQEIIYTIKEVGPSAVNSYIPEYEGINITNTYHPYGDLTLTKNVINDTDACEGHEFNFIFTFTKDDEPVLGEFEYDILSEETVVRSGTISNNGSIKLRKDEKVHIKELPEGTNYTIEEESKAGYNILSSSNLANTIKPNDTQEAVVKNEYNAEGRFNLTLDKILTNRKIMKSQFIFEMYDENGTLIKTASNSTALSTTMREDGTVDYSKATATFGALYYNENDHNQTYTYTIKERDRGREGYEYDTTIYTLQVTPVDNGDGTMAITKKLFKNEEEVSTAEFENHYVAEGSVVLRAWKTLEGRRLTDNEFEFELLDEEGNVLQTKINSADGSIAFDAITYNETDIEKTYYYVIREKDGTDETVNYDKNTYGYKVTVVDNGDGTLSAVQGTVKVNIEQIYITEQEFKNNYVIPFVVPGWYCITSDLDQSIKERAEELLRELNIPNFTEVSRTYFPQVSYPYLGMLFDDASEMGTGYAPVLVNLPGENQLDENIDYGIYIYPGHRGQGTIDDYSEGIRLDGLVLESMLTKENIVISEEEGELPVFKNTLKDGSLSVEKHVSNPEGADPNKEFKFKVKFIGQDIENKEFEITREKLPYNTYLTYNANGGIFEDGESKNQFTYIVNKGNATLLAGEYLEPTREMYVFDGWYEDRECTIEFTENPEEASITENKTVYAKWKKTEAYAVLDDDGNLIMFRSANDYTNNTTGTFTDIKGNEYMGRIFADLETTNSNNLYNSRWYNYNLSIKTVSIAEGQKIQPINTVYWFVGCRYMISCDLAELDTSKVTNMGCMFKDCDNLTSLDVSNFDTSNVSSMYSMFEDCGNLTSLDVSHFDTSNVTNMNYMFSYCKNLTSLDVSHFDTSNVTNMFSIFSSCQSLTSLDTSHFDTSRVTDMGFVFHRCTNLTTTLNIMNMPSDYSYMCQAAAMQNGAQITLRYIDPVTSANIDTLVNTKSPNSDVINGGEGTFIPPDTSNVWNENNPSPAKIVDNTSNGNTDNNENPENNSGENTENPGTSEDPEDIVFENGEAEFTLKANDKIIFNNIPAGTTYQVYEETPDGWVLIEQENISGIIQPLETSEAKFTNKYQPGTASVQFNGTKTLDNRPAQADAFSFELWEGDTLLETVSTLDGGFIQFSVINYLPEDIGTHTYRIVEVNPNRNDIDYDTHEEFITVEVSGDVTNLTTNVTYDNDGINFKNTTRPGSLEIRKNVNGQTEANKDDEFTVKITFENENGVPLGDNIYYYKKNSDGEIVNPSMGKRLLSLLNGENTALHKAVISPIGTNKGETAQPLNNDLYSSQYNMNNMSVNTEPQEPIPNKTTTQSATKRSSLLNTKGSSAYTPDSGIITIDGYEINTDGMTQVQLNRAVSDPSRWHAYDAEGILRYTPDMCGEDPVIIFQDNGEVILTSVNYSGYRDTMPTFNNPRHINYAWRPDDWRYTITDIKGNTYTGIVAKYYGTGASGSGLNGVNDEFVMFTLDERTAENEGFAELLRNVRSIKVAEGVCMTQGENYKMGSLPFIIDGLPNLEEVDLRGLLQPSWSTYGTPPQRFFEQITVKNCPKLRSLNISTFMPEYHFRENYPLYKGYYGGSNWEPPLWFVGENCPQLNIDNALIPEDSYLGIPVRIEYNDGTVLWFMSTQLGDDTEIGSTIVDTAGNSYIVTDTTSIERRGFHAYSNNNGYISVAEGNIVPILKNSTSADGLSQEATKSVDLRGVDFKCLSDFRGLFTYFTNMEELSFHGAVNLADNPSMAKMLQYCFSLKEIDLSMFKDDGYAVNSIIGSFVDISPSWSDIGNGMRCALEKFIISEYTNINGRDYFKWPYVLKDFLLYTDESGKWGNAWLNIDTGDVFNAKLHNNNREANSYTFSPGTWVRMTQGLSFDGNEGIYIGEPLYINYFPTPFDGGSATLLPDSNLVYRPGYKLIGWSPLREGAPYIYPAGNDYNGINRYVFTDDMINVNTKKLENLTVHSGTNGVNTLYDYAMPKYLYPNMTLYAQWEYDGLNSVVEKHYKENVNGEYVLAESNHLRDEAGVEITISPKDYPGFHTDATSQTVLIPNINEDPIVIEYYYERDKYTISFDANGGEGQPIETINAIGDVQYYLPLNTFSKNGSIFNYWSTNSDGTGEHFLNGEPFMNLGEDNEHITLYAQWASPTEMPTSTQGEIIVTLKGNETLTFIDLPAGTKYKVEEINVPEGWRYQFGYGDTRIIYPDWTNYSYVYNEYQATGSVSIELYKNLEGREPVEGEFTFYLTQESHTENGVEFNDWMQIETVTNQSVDLDTHILNENGETVQNPYYSYAPIKFSEIIYTQPGIYNYTIREDIWGQDETVIYDETTLEVQVIVTDMGKGRLDTKVIYKDDKRVFNNKIKNQAGVLKVTKKSEQSDNTSQFDFSVLLKDRYGNPLRQSYPYKIKHLNYTQETVGVNDIRYSHMDNIVVDEQSYDGHRTIGSYKDNTEYNQVISILGATSLDVTIYYESEGVDYDWACLWEGEHPEYTARNDYVSSLSGKLGGEHGGHNVYSIKTYHIPGNSVTFGFHSDAGDSGWYGYGYFAIVQAKEEILEDGITIGNISNDGVFTLKADESIEIYDLPDGATYEIIELPKDGWTNTNKTNDIGTIIAGETIESVFTNRYDASGNITFEGTKEFYGGDLSEEIFTFTVTDEEGNIISSGQSQEDGSIKFTPIDYTLEDVGNTYIYYISETTDGRNIEFDSHTEVVTIEVIDNGDGTITGNITYDDDGAVFTNIILQELEISKEVAGTMGNKEQDFTFALELSGDYDKHEITYTKGTETGIVDSNKFTFTLKDNETIKFSGIVKGVEYTITENNYSSEGYTTNAETSNGEISTTLLGKVKANGELSEDTTVKYTNTRETTVPTKVSLYNNNLYILIGLISLIGILFFIKRKVRA